MAYVLDVQKAVVHLSQQCPEIAGNSCELRYLTNVGNLTNALMVASDHINKYGSSPPISINACHICIHKKTNDTAKGQARH